MFHTKKLLEDKIENIAVDKPILGLFLGMILDLAGAAIFVIVLMLFILKWQGMV